MRWKKRQALGTSYILVFLFCISIINAEAGEDEFIVVTKQGVLRGIQQSSPGGPVKAFLGIPFGQPPIGNLRFKKSLPAKPWPGILNATHYGKTCYQTVPEITPGFEWAERWIVNTELSEDCLNLNVWVPSGKQTKATVMVLIYGGGFTSGTSSLPVYDPRVLVQTENIIVVSMNYRIGPLGFLAFPGNPEAPGNAGLFDQQLALQWVQENIAAFGGDSEKVTLFGLSAGAASVDYHMLSHASHPLFAKAICESGSVNAQWSFVSQQESRERALTLASLLGCSSSNDSEVIVCLKTKNPKEITDHQFSILSSNSFSITYFAPTVDGEFLTDAPKVLLKQGKFKQADILAGVTKDEGSLFLLTVGVHLTKDKNTLLNRTELKEALKFYFPNSVELELESILDEYTDHEDKENREKNRNALIQTIGDYYFVCPATEAAQQYAEHGSNVFLYMFDHQNVQMYLPDWMGVLHCAEREYLFGEPLNGTNTFLDAEQVLSKQIMRYWANFARTGNPTEVGAGASEWLKFTSTEQNYATLNTKPLQVHRNLHSQQCKFWASQHSKKVQFTEPGGTCLNKETSCTEAKSSPHDVEDIGSVYSQPT